MITLTFSPSDTELLAGIPKSVEITASGAGTIYYTLDGSVPTLLSNVYTDAIEMPTNIGEVTLSAIGYSSSGVPGPILSQRYYTDHSDLDRTRYIHFEGVVYAYPGGTNTPIWYDKDGEAVFSIDVPEYELDLVAPDRDHLGAIVEADTAVDLLLPSETPDLYDDNFVLYDTPNGADDFNPDALLIVVDGRSTAEDQLVRLTNGPYMSLRDERKNYNGIEFYSTKGENYVSGTATKYHYDRAKGIIVFYYFDSNNGRWVKSIQDLDQAPAPARVPSFNPPHVFHWFEWGRRQSSH